MTRALAVAVLAALALLAAGCGAETEYAARFDNARGLVAGNDVRVAGAIAGRVTAVRLARDGSAEVRFTLADAAAAPRRDAAAAIRPVDLLGDTYLSLSPGRAGAPLRGPIPVARTSNAPRLDELLRVFRPGVRDGLRAMLVEGGLALDRRGGDLAATTVALRPALGAADGVLAELDGQRRALARLVPEAERAAAQLADRDRDLGPLLDGLARTVRATRAAAPALDRGLRGMPATLRRARGTAAELERVAGAAEPLARDLRDTAPALTAAAAGLDPLLRRVRSATPALRPLLRSTRSLLAGGAPTLAGLAAGLPRLRAAAPDIAALTDALVPAAPEIAKGFLEAFPDQAAEPGDQPFDPFADRRRTYWRGAAVFSCEAFGVPIAPGCLGRVLGGGGERDARDRAPAAKTPTPAPAERAPAVPKLPRLPELDLPRLLPGLPEVPLPDRGGGEAVGDLLDFLLR